MSAIFFGGRRPSGVPLIYQAISWEHGVFMGEEITNIATYSCIRDFIERNGTDKRKKISSFHDQRILPSLGTESTYCTVKMIFHSLHWLYFNYVYQS